MKYQTERKIMKKTFIKYKIITACILFIVTLPISTIITADELPPPIQASMNFEETLWRRSSVRNFTSESVSIEDLSTILWAAYGVRDDGQRTVKPINGSHATSIYILMEDSVYRFQPENHSLTFFKNGDYRFIAQYDSPIVLGLAWNASINPDPNSSALEIGAVGQNIQLMTNALGLGCVICGDFPPFYSLQRIGLPENETGRIVIPLGHLQFPYKFRYRPLHISLLPKIQQSTFSITEALNARNETNVWSGELTRSELSQILWSTYGYSPYIDRSEFGFTYHISRHRTVPSAHGYYPLRIFGVTAQNVVEFIPNTYDPLNFLFLSYFPFPVFTYLKQIAKEDMRAKVANATTQPACSQAPLLIVIVLDIEKTRPEGGDDFSGPEMRNLWCFEAGAAAHNALLEAAVWNLTANTYLPTDNDAIRSTLGLEGEFTPLFVIPIGKP
jgi:nitroreductase